MRGVDYYYSAIQRELFLFNVNMGQEFKIYSETHSPREVFLWLEQRRMHNQLPINVRGLLTDFYWEIA
jgi:hypothetical protein